MQSWKPEKLGRVIDFENDPQKSWECHGILLTPWLKIIN